MLDDLSSFVERTRLLSIILALISIASVGPCFNGLRLVTWVTCSNLFLSLLMIQHRWEFVRVLLTTARAHERMREDPLSLGLRHFIEHIDVVEHLGEHLIDLLCLPLYLLLPRRVIPQLFSDDC